MENVKLAVIYYSSTGTNHQLAKWAEEGAKEAGAEVKVLKVPELAPRSAIESNPLWKAHADATEDVPEAKSEDLEWADAIIFSVPTRFGNVASQMKQFLDLQGGLWAQGKLANKVVSAMSSAQNPTAARKQQSWHCIQPCIIGAPLWRLRDIRIPFCTERAEIRTGQASLLTRMATWSRM